jgi:type IX secretion system PorP/SprF family membrane protein
VPKIEQPDLNLTTMKKIIFLFLLFCSYTVLAQQDPLFTQYMFNKLLVNPAYAGSKEVMTIDVLNRTQWVGIGGAPSTMTISAHTAMKNKKVGFGVYLYRDVLGATSTQSFMATYAYRIYMERSSLAFGLQFGFDYFDFNWSALVSKDPDSVFDPQNVRRITPDANFGIYYQSHVFYLGLSSKQLLSNNFSKIIGDGKTTFSKLTQHFYLMGGYALPVKDKVVFRPSVMVKYTPHTPMQFDFNTSVLFGNVFWVGASYRTAKAITLLTEIRIADHIKLGYSYDLYLNQLQAFNYGSHEIRIGFEFPLWETKMLTPRYF